MRIGQTIGVLRLIVLTGTLLAHQNATHSQDDLFDDSPSAGGSDVAGGEVLDDQGFGLDGFDGAPAGESGFGGGSSDAPASDDFIGGGYDYFGGGEDSFAPGDKPSSAARRPRSSDRNSHQQVWQQLRQKVLEAKDETTRKQRGAELQKFLEGVFDEDLARREKELSKLEARLKKLRDSVESRKTNRDRIIGVRMDSLMLDAQGLGLPGLGTPSFDNNAGNHPKFQIDSLKVLGRNGDGSVAVQVVYTVLKDEKRTRAIQKTSFKRRPNTNEVVPVTEQVEQMYVVRVPTQFKADAIIPAGEDMTLYLEKHLQSAESTGSEVKAIPRAAGLEWDTPVRADGGDDIFN